jgi:hypothetical protein
MNFEASTLALGTSRRGFSQRVSVSSVAASVMPQLGRVRLNLEVRGNM